MDPIIVIGAGAAGIMAARRAAELGSEVLLLEKTPRLGTKILISGGGKCNITHDGPIEDVLRAFRSNEARFIRPSCYRLTNRQVISMLTDRGLEVYTRPDGRIFPVDRTAKDVVAILRRLLDEVGVRIRFDTPVRRIIAEGGKVVGVESAAGLHKTSHAIIAVGGSSYPNSGTTGDGYKWAADLGHTLITVRAALAPIKLRETRWRQFSGVALRDVLLKARQSGKEISRWRGDTLITHFGISGPSTLEISRDVAAAMERDSATIEVDLLPHKTFEIVDHEVIEFGKSNPNRRIGAFLSFVPERLIPEILHDSCIDSDTSFAKLSRVQRSKLVANLKGWQFGDVEEVILDKGEVVAGGVSLDEVDAQSMRSKKCTGLYCCGEVLDIAGPVGGYNLQAAFATGWVAGETAHNDGLRQS
jgi:predicted Rossmann fold flavoprotein